MKKVTAVLLAFAFAALILQPIAGHVNIHLTKTRALLDGEPPPPPPPPWGW